MNSREKELLLYVLSFTATVILTSAVLYIASYAMLGSTTLFVTNNGKNSHVLLGGKEYMDRNTCYRLANMMDIRNIELKKKIPYTSKQGIEDCNTIFN